MNSRLCKKYYKFSNLLKILFSKLNTRNWCFYRGMNNIYVSFNNKSILHVRLRKNIVDENVLQ